MNTIAVYPGSFDPITNGHLDIVGPGRRPSSTGSSSASSPTRGRRRSSPVETRDRGHPRGARASAGGRRRAHRGRGVRRPDRRLLPAPAAPAAIVRGLRAISDFETEMQLAHNNRVLAPEVDTVFFMTSVEQRLRQLEPGQGDRRLRRRRRRRWSRPAAAAAPRATALGRR